MRYSWGIFSALTMAAAHLYNYFWAGLWSTASVSLRCALAVIKRSCGDKLPGDTGLCRWWNISFSGGSDVAECSTGHARDKTVLVLLIKTTTLGPLLRARGKTGQRPPEGETEQSPPGERVRVRALKINASALSLNSSRIAASIALTTRGLPATILPLVR